MRSGFRLPELSLRVRLLVLLVVLALVGLAVADVVSYRALHNYLYDRVDQQLESAVQPVSMFLAHKSGRDDLIPGQAGGGAGLSGSAFSGGSGTGGGPPAPEGGFGEPGGAPNSQLVPGVFGQLRTTGGKVIGHTSFTFGGDEVPLPALPSDLDVSSLGDISPVTVGQRGGGSEQFRAAAVRGLHGPADRLDRGGQRRPHGAAHLHAAGSLGRRRRGADPRRRRGRGVSATNPLTIARAGSDTINGAASAVIAKAYGYLVLESDGTSKWTLVDTVALRPENNLSDLANPSAALANLGGASSATVAQQSDLNVLQQNLLYQGLLLAAMRGVPTGIVDGILDPLSNLSDINVAASSGYAFNAAAGDDRSCAERRDTVPHGVDGIAGDFPTATITRHSPLQTGSTAASQAPGRPPRLSDLRPVWPGSVRTSARVTPSLYLRSNLSPGTRQRQTSHLHWSNALTPPLRTLLRLGPPSRPPRSTRRSTA